MRTVAIVNQHTNNYGDDAAGVAVVDAILTRLQPDELHIHYIWQGVHSEGLPVDSPAVHHHFLNDLSGVRDVRPTLAFNLATRMLGRKVRRPALAAMLRRCKEAQLVVVSPAGSNIGIYKDWMYLLIIALLTVEGVRPLFHLNTIGPSQSRIFNFLSRLTLRRCEITVRERASKEWLKGMGLDSYLGVDSALMQPADITSTSTNRGPIAVVPTRLANWHRDFKGSDESALWQDKLVAAVAKGARTSGLPVTIVPHLYGAQDESSALSGLAESLRATGCDATIVDVQSVQDYRRALAEAKVVVSMRYHGLVLGGHAGVPVVSLAYENKMVEAADYLGLAELALDVRTFAVGDLTDRIERAIKNDDRFRAALRELIPSLQAKASSPLASAALSFSGGAKQSARSEIESTAPPK